MNMDKLVALNKQAAGREKIARLVQFSSRALWNTLESADVRPGMVQDLKSLEYVMGTFRKLMNFGKCLDIFYASLNSLNNPDMALRLTLTMAKISQSLQFFIDHFVLLGRIGLLKSLDIKKWTHCAHKCWVVAIMMNLCRDMYEISRIIFAHRNSMNSLSRPVPGSFNTRLTLQPTSTDLWHKDVVVDTVKNVCDIFIPLTALGYTKLSARTVGLLGTISSLAGLLALVEPTAKLTPA